MWQRLKKAYFKYERILFLVSLIVGFIFNAIVLTRVDLFWDNFWIIVNIILCAISIVVINYEKKPTYLNSETVTIINLYILQFAFGGLLSTFIVYYFRSAVLAVAWPFLLILVVALTINELFRHKYTRMDFQVLFLFLSVYLYMAFLVPVIVKDIGQTIFFASGVSSLIFITIFIFILRKTATHKYKSERKTIILSIIGVVVVFNSLFVLNLIPPLPLSLSDADIVHDINRNIEGKYVVTLEKEDGLSNIRELFGDYGTYHLVNGPTAFVYSSIFAPKYFSENIVHEWQYYDSVNKSWNTQFVTNLSVIGGRSLGFRTYSTYKGVVPGSWRVNVRLVDGPVIGRVSFRASTEYFDNNKLVTKVIE